MIRREWLDWTAPCLPQAAAWLAGELEQGGLCDGHRAICVLPGNRAGRLLLGLLLQHCRDAGRGLVPPRIITPGQLVDVLFPADRPLASPTEQVLAWMACLRAAAPETLRPLVAEPPDPHDHGAWHALASTISRLHEELGGEGVSFRDAAARSAAFDLAREADRWEALESLLTGYYAALANVGLSDRNRSAWEQVKARAASPQPPALLALIGVVDLNALQRAAVAAYAEATVALIHAPQELADHFDAFGCASIEQWTQRRIDVAESDRVKLIVADRPDDQAQAALRAIASLGGAISPERVTVGLGDEQLGPQLRRAGAWAGLDLHSPVERPLDQTAPARLIEAAAAWVADPRFATFAALLRHPDLEALLLRSDAGGPAATHRALPDWLGLLDRYFSDCLADRLTEPWLGQPQLREQLKAIHDAVHRVLAPLLGESRPLGQWVEPILQLFATVYDPPDQDAAALQDQAVAACLAIGEALAPLRASPRSLQPVTDAAAALRLALAIVAGQALPAELRNEQVEMLGWLELHLDIAPILVITGFNDDRIPQAVLADAFLPDTLRRSLGLLHNERRYARDACLLESILHSRERVTIISGRRGADDAPLTPSRLLLTCEPSDLPGRVLSLCDERAARTYPRAIGAAPPASRSRFEIPPLPPVDPPAAMPVTWFREYLECPYRFALRRLVDIRAVSDGGLELDPLQFGTLAHDVLREFGADPAYLDSVDAAKIEKRLLSALQTAATERYGRSPLPAVRVQLARLEQRFSAFARWQARHRTEGWRIVHCELSLKKDFLLDVPGQNPMPLKAKIDRVDRHEESRAWQILDYKTGDAGASPHKTHHGGERISDEWLDLQLPLYSFMAAQRAAEPIAGDVRLGYIVLPKDPEEDLLRLAEWEPAQLDMALDTAREVVRNIRAGNFVRNPDFHSEFDEFARICQSLTYARDEHEENEGDEP